MVLLRLAGLGTASVGSFETRVPFGAVLRDRLGRRGPSYVHDGVEPPRQPLEPTRRRASHRSPEESITREWSSVEIEGMRGSTGLRAR
jgi:hypothetical protein